MKVQFHTRSPLLIEADADEFGSMFSKMNSEEQVEVFRAMIKHMQPFRTQWDYISIEIEKSENSDVRDFFRDWVSSISMEGAQ